MDGWKINRHIIKSEDESAKLNLTGKKIVNYMGTAMHVLNVNMKLNTTHQNLEEIIIWITLTNKLVALHDYGNTAMLSTTQIQVLGRREVFKLNLIYFDVSHYIAFGMISKRLNIFNITS